MGCATSKEPPVCRNCKGSRAPITRSYSMHVHHPPQTDGDSYHVVALKSTTLGYLQLDPSISNEIRQESVELYKENPQFSVGVIDAKTWSKMIDEKIPKIVPKTPVRTPPGEPETINAWELMEGLDDTSPLRPKSDAKSNHIRSFSFHVNPNNLKSLDFPQPAIFSDEMPPPEKFSDELPETATDSCGGGGGGGGDALGGMNSEKLLQPGFCGDGKNVSMPRVQEKLVLYFTSLRGVRKTYEDCCHVRQILKGTGVRVDERDVSMHSGFKEELKELLGGVIGGGLPKVFIGSKCIGGAAEIRRLHEDGNLEKAVEGCEMVDDGGCGGGGGCEACGDIRFLPCETCSGSCKIYYENEDECDEDEDDDDHDDGDEEKEESDYGFQRCPDCNENGLIRCPICCD